MDGAPSQALDAADADATDHRNGRDHRDRHGGHDRHDRRDGRDHDRDRGRDGLASPGQLRATEQREGASERTFQAILTLTLPLPLP